MESPIEFFKNVITSKFVGAVEILNSSPYNDYESYAWYSINRKDPKEILNIQVSQEPPLFEITSYYLTEQNINEFTNGGFPHIHHQKKLIISGFYNDNENMFIQKENAIHRHEKRNTPSGEAISIDNIFIKICESYHEAF